MRTKKLFDFYCLIQNKDSRRNLRKPEPTIFPLIIKWYSNK